VLANVFESHVVGCVADEGCESQPHGIVVQVRPPPPPGPPPASVQAVAAKAAQLKQDMVPFPRDKTSRYHVQSRLITDIGVTCSFLGVTMCATLFTKMKKPEAPIWVPISFHPISFRLNLSTVSSRRPPTQIVGPRVLI